MYKIFFFFCTCVSVSHAMHCIALLCWHVSLHMMKCARSVVLMFACTHTSTVAVCAGNIFGHISLRHGSALEKSCALHRDATFSRGGWKSCAPPRNIRSDARVNGECWMVFFDALASRSVVRGLRSLGLVGNQLECHFLDDSADGWYCHDAPADCGDRPREY